MSFEVVDRDQQELPVHAMAFGRDPDEQRADETGALSHDPVDVAELRARVGQRLANDRRHQLEVAARGDLGDTPYRAWRTACEETTDESTSPVRHDRPRQSRHTTSRFPGSR